MNSLLSKQQRAVLFLTAFTATMQVGLIFRMEKQIKTIEEFEPVVVQEVTVIEESEEAVEETEITVEETETKVEETKVDKPEIIVKEEPVEEAKTYIGTFKAYAYCDCEKCCGKWSGSPTASGTTPTQGRTIAVDPDVIPLGTEVYIEGYGNFVAEDTGTGINGNTIDVFHINHADALAWGVRQVEIYKII